MKVLKFILAFGLTVCAWVIPTLLIDTAFGMFWDSDFMGVLWAICVLLPPAGILALTFFMPRSPWRLGMWWGLAAPLVGAVAYFGFYFFLVMQL